MSFDSFMNGLVMTAALPADGTDTPPTTATCTQACEAETPPTTATCTQACDAETPPTTATCTQACESVTPPTTATCTQACDADTPPTTATCTQACAASKHEFLNGFLAPVQSSSTKQQFQSAPSCVC